MRSKKSIFFTTLFTTGLIVACLPGEIPGTPESHFFVYLTYPSEDTARSIAINYHHTQKEHDLSQVYYDVVPRDGDPNSYSFHATGKSKTMSRIARTVHSVTLENLLPDTAYYFIVGDDKGGFSSEKRFKTLPEENKTVRFVQGGDMGTDPSLKDLLSISASYDPDLAVIGGDIAYANGELQNFRLWDDWLKWYTQAMVSPEGDLIPMMLAIGNHEVGSFLKIFKKQADFFFFLFEQNGKTTYFTRQLSTHTRFFVLDTGHMTSYESQVSWLTSELHAASNIPNKLAVYHIPLYPSHRPYDLSDAKKGREHWGPVFDEYGLTAAFENHDHTQKRTKLLKNNEVSTDGTGTIYFGDGCWGKSEREAHPNRWYLDKALSKKHFWLVDASEQSLDLRAIDSANQVIDTYKIVH